MRKLSLLHWMSGISFSVLLLALSAAWAMAAETKVEPKIEKGTAWYDVAQWDVEGQCWKDVERHYARCPLRAKKTLPSGVWGNSQHSAGLLVRFKTDATTISVRYKLYSAGLSMPHMPATGASGLDLYALYKGKWSWVSCTRPTQQEATAQLISGLEPGLRDYLIYFPLYNGVDHLEIGVPEKQQFTPVAPRTEKSIFYYGTSIAHGGCCSRPGMAFTAILGRRLDLPVVNFGFSGSARMEPEVAKLMAEVDPAVYVLDALPNMTPEMTATRCIPFIQILRNAHPTTPILLVEDRDYSNSYIRPAAQKVNQDRRKGLKDAYDHFIAKGDKNIYYLSHKNLIGDDLDFDSTMDSSHLNDLGMYRMTDSLEKALRPILKK